MAKTSQYVQVGKRKIELTNLAKVLWPEDGIVKAELIQFYLRLAPTILAHMKGRALSLVRYPDGIYEEQFFQKNKPKWAPAWIESERIGDKEKKIDYVVATEEASLVWLANLACIEMHQIHARRPHFDKPDYFVFDLDPPDGTPFAEVAKLGLELREHVASFGYHPFVKTTGRKGLHIVCPLEPKWSFDDAFEAAKAVAQPFVKAHAKATTLHINKENRKGRVLIDIYRNRPHQTIVGAYSVRGLAGATVSTPLTWEQLDGATTLQDWNIHTVPDMVLADGDAWEGIGAYATALHTKRKAAPKKKTLPKSRKRKTPEALDDYAAKREFTRTPEPRGMETGGNGDAFCVHRHHASRLHYDLRLEQDGTLKSWAVPRGLPPRPGIKRLAVQTEDHPLEYLTFEGVIPKGEYGGGTMWVFANGRYEITKTKKDGFYVRLQSRELNAEYRLYKTSKKEWLMERVDTPQIDYLNDNVDFMLSNSDTKPPASDDWIYEVKWDGIRAMIAIDEGEVRILSRNQRDITAPFPELLAPDEAFHVSGALLDCEIVCLDEAGRPVFKDVIHRMRQTSERAIERNRIKTPAFCYVFDCLYLDGRNIMNEPLVRRRQWLRDIIKPDAPYRMSETVDDGQALFRAASEMGLEGIMAKERTSTYLPGRRSSQWLKVKTRHTIDCVIVGFTEGKGVRNPLFGALHIAQYVGDTLKYLGKVGTGFDDRRMKDVLTELELIKKTKGRPIKEKPLDDAQTTWLEPKLFCEVRYASLTSAGTLREPVFVRMRPDLTIDD